MFQMLNASFKCKAALVDVVMCIIFCDITNSVNANEFESKCTFESCNNIICTAIIDVESPIADHINQVVQGECNMPVLFIRNSVFDNAILKPNWLSALKPSIKIYSLTLDTCKLDVIEKGAFSNHPFTKLEILFLVNTGLKVIKHDIFEGLRFLTGFGFKSYNNPYELIIEEQAFSNVSTYLKTLEINTFTIGVESLINLFGIKGAHMPSMQILDLRYNFIEKIPENAFKRAFKLQMIYLELSGIREVDENAFSENTDLRELQLANNSIETLKPLTFQNLQSLKTSGLSLNGNNWDCKCSLQWLKDMYLSNNIISQKIPLQCSNGLNFKDFEFCPITPIIPPAYTTLICEVINSSLSRAAEIDTVRTVEILIKNELLTLEFQELEYEPLQVEIIISNIASDALRNYFLSWFNSNNHSDNGCIKLSNNTTRITDLNRATTYTFSLIKENETEISPKASFGFTTSPEWSQRPWILNNEKALVLALTTVITIFLGLLAAIITFLCLRTNRNGTIEQNNLVGIPKDNYSCIDSGSTKEYEKPAYWEPYIAASNQGYLTPKHNKYDKVKCRPSLSRSVSEWSMYTTSAIYDEYNCKNTDIWSTSQYKKRANYKQNLMNRYDEFKPPLPPPNPQV